MASLLALYTLCIAAVSATNVTSSLSSATGNDTLSTGAAVSTGNATVVPSSHSNSTSTSCPSCSSVPTSCVDSCVPTPICTAHPCEPVCEECSVVTTVVTEFTTYCPEPTTLCTNDVCHTVTAPGTLVVTNCPCTIVTAVSSASAPGAVATANGAASLGSSLLLGAAAFVAALF